VSAKIFAELRRKRGGRCGLRACAGQCEWAMPRGAAPWGFDGLRR